MKQNKKNSLIMLLSAGALLGLFGISGQTVHAADSTPATSENSQRMQLNDQSAQLIKNAGIDPSTLTNTQIRELNMINFGHISNQVTGTQWTYQQYAGTGHKMINQDPQYRMPYFNAKKIKNMPATYTRDAQTGKKAHLDVWDSWPVQDAQTAHISNYKGYQLAVAMMGIPNQNDSHIYLLYNKYNDNKLSHWKTAGPIFGFHAKPTHQEWSGSATVNSDGTIQLFYTDVDTHKGDNNQMISSVNLRLAIKHGRISIAKRRNRHVVFAGDGYHYQTYKQWRSTNQGPDNMTMRDAHIISDHGHRYLAFEASTGTQNYQGPHQIYDWQNYGAENEENVDTFLEIVANTDMASRASWSNAALGILRLDDNEDDPKVAQVMTPLITSNLSSDEIERPSIVPMNGKYYLFASTRLNRGVGDVLWLTANQKIGDNVAMLGWVSDHLTYGYKPLNGDGTVLVASVPFNWRTSTYSYYAVPTNDGSNNVLVTSYMTNRGFAAGKGKYSTWAPSFLVKINANNTTQVTNRATNQGDWTFDKNSENDSMIVNNISGARLKGERNAYQQGKLRTNLAKKLRKAKKRSYSVRKRR